MAGLNYGDQNSGYHFHYGRLGKRLFGVTCPLSLELSSFMSWESLVTDRYSLWNDGFEHHSRKICNKLEIRHPRIVVFGWRFPQVAQFLGETSTSAKCGSFRWSHPKIALVDLVVKPCHIEPIIWRSMLGEDVSRSFWGNPRFILFLQSSLIFLSPFCWLDPVSFCCSNHQFLLVQSPCVTIWGGAFQNHYPLLGHLKNGSEIVADELLRLHTNRQKKNLECQSGVNHTW